MAQLLRLDDQFSMKDIEEAVHAKSSFWMDRSKNVISIYNRMDSVWKLALLLIHRGACPNQHHALFRASHREQEIFENAESEESYTAQCATDKKYLKDRSLQSGVSLGQGFVFPDVKARSSDERCGQPQRPKDDTRPVSPLADRDMGKIFECWEMDLFQDDGPRNLKPVRLLHTHSIPPRAELLETTELAHHKYRRVLHLLGERRIYYYASRRAVSLHGTTECYSGSNLSGRRLIIYFSVMGGACVAPIARSLDDVHRAKVGMDLDTYEPWISFDDLIIEQSDPASIDDRRMRSDISETGPDTNSILGDTTDNQNPNKGMPQSPVAPDRIHADAPELFGHMDKVDITEIYLNRISITDLMDQTWTADTKLRRNDDVSIDDRRSEVMLDCISITSSMKRVLTPAVHNRPNAIRKETDEERIHRVVRKVPARRLNQRGAKLPKQVSKEYELRLSQV